MRQDTWTHRKLKFLIHVSNVINSSLDIDTIFDSINKWNDFYHRSCRREGLFRYLTKIKTDKSWSQLNDYFIHIFLNLLNYIIVNQWLAWLLLQKMSYFLKWKGNKTALDTLTLYNRDLLDRSISNNFHFTSVISSPLLQKRKYE
jgi:hypothetical protein